MSTFAATARFSIVMYVGLPAVVLFWIGRRFLNYIKGGS